MLFYNTVFIRSGWNEKYKYYSKPFIFIYFKIETIFSGIISFIFGNANIFSYLLDNVSRCLII